MHSGSMVAKVVYMWLFLLLSLFILGVAIASTYYFSQLRPGKTSIGGITIDSGSDVGTTMMVLNILVCVFAFVLAVMAVLGLLATYRYRGDSAVYGTTY